MSIAIKMKRPPKAWLFTLSIVALVAISVLVIKHFSAARGRPVAPISLSGAATSPPQTVTPTASGHGRNSPSGKATPVSLPASWPVDIPVPDGTLTGAATSGTSINIIASGQYQDVVRSIQQRYTSHGFKQLPGSPLQFENNRYLITVAVENRDHSPTSDNVVVSVLKK